MNKTKSILILFLLLLISLSSLALEQEKLIGTKLRIKGRLIEKGTKNKLMNFKIFFLPSGDFVESNEKGEFSYTIKNNNQDKIKILVNATGYYRYEEDLFLDQKEKTQIIYLEKMVYSGFETTVTAKKDKKDYAKKTLKVAEIINAPGAQNDPVKAVQNFPGVANQTLNSQIIIQGAAPDDTRYSLNGHEIPLVFHFGGISSIVQAGVVDDVEFLSAGYGPEFGRAQGGVINLKTKRPNSDKLKGTAFVDLYNSGFLLEGPINEKSSFFVGGRQSYIGAVFEKIAEKEKSFDLTIAPTFSDVFVSYDNRLTAQSQLTINAIKSKDELSFVLKEPINNDPDLRGDFYQKTEFYRIQPIYQVELANGDRADFSLGFGENNIFVELGDRYFDLETKTFSKRLNYDHQVSDNWMTYWGYDGQTVDYNVGLKFPSVYSEGDITNPTSAGELDLTRIKGQSVEQAVFLRNEWLLGENKKWKLSPNLRLEEFSQINKSYVMPRVSLSWQQNESINYFLSSGTYYQAPQNGESTRQVGNPKLVAEKSTHLTLGLEKDFRQNSQNGFVFTPSLFTKDLEDQIIQSNKLDSKGKPERYSNDGTGRIKGFESRLKYRHQEYSAALNYTYLDSQRSDPNNKNYPSEYDQTHNFNLIGSWEGNRYSFATRFRYVTGNPYTPVTSGIYDSDNDAYIPVRGRLFSKRYQSFKQLDFRIDRKWIYNTWILKAYLDIQNITNQKNPMSIVYEYDYSDSVETTGLPIIPIFGIQGEF
jgi:hypothetical protein